MIDLNQLPRDITSHIQKFRTFLNHSWESLNLLMCDHDWDEDGWFTSEWLQVNWEFLVERELLGKDEFLFPLEWNKRITYPKAQPKYIISCEIVGEFKLLDCFKETDNYKNEDLLIVGFCTPIKTTYGLYPPFNYAEVRTLDRKKRYVIPIDNCRFFLKKAEI